MKSLLTIINLIIVPGLFGQSMPNERYSQWKDNGFIPISNNWIEIDFIQAGGYADGATPNDAILDSIIQANLGNSVSILFGNGNFRFNATVVLPSNFKISGNGLNNTIFTFNLSESQHCIKIEGSSILSSENLTTNLLRGDSTIECSSIANLSVGDLIIIKDNDNNLITDSWAAGSTGQIFKITDITGNLLSVDQYARRNFDFSTATVTKINPAQNIIIEGIEINREDITSAQTNNVFFNYAFNCLVNCVYSRFTNFAHVEISNSSHITIHGCYFEDAHSYGNGGKAYGVVCQFSSGDNLIEKNYFNHLRHAMLLQAGANGNVYAYNYSTNPFWTGTSLPSNSSGDIVLHGNFPYCNLFEGNRAQNLVIDDSHGINGHYNTFLRNRLDGYGIYMNNNPATDSQNLIGNEITNSGFFMGLYNIAGTNHYLYGNNKLGNAQPAGTNNPNDVSFYLDGIPEFYANNATWPPIGLPRILNEENIQTAVNVFNQMYTSCEKDSMIFSNQIENLEKKLLFFPNPGWGILNCNFNDLSGARMSVSDLTGRIIYNGTYKNSIENFPSGVYLISIVSKDKLTWKGTYIKQ